MDTTWILIGKTGNSWQTGNSLANPKAADAAYQGGFGGLRAQPCCPGRLLAAGYIAVVTGLLLQERCVLSFYLEVGNVKQEQREI